MLTGNAENPPKSPPRVKDGLKRVNRQCEKQNQADLKAFEALCRRDFACTADAKETLAAFERCNG
jgi:hypothetical protein